MFPLEDRAPYTVVLGQLLRHDSWLKAKLCMVPITLEYSIVVPISYFLNPDPVDLHGITEFRIQIRVKFLKCYENRIIVHLPIVDKYRKKRFYVRLRNT